jgi:hypothetical protein
MGHRVKPGDDKTPGPAGIFSVEHHEVPSGFGWIATISKPILLAGIKLTPGSDRIRSQP